MNLSARSNRHMGSLLLASSCSRAALLPTFLPTIVAPLESVSRKTKCDLPEFSLAYGVGKVVYTNGCFFFDQNGSRCITVSILRREARGRDVRYASTGSVAARVSLARKSQIVCSFVAHWMGRAENQITLDPGKAEAILLASPQPDALEIYDSVSHPFPLQNPDPRLESPRKHPARPKAIPLADNEELVCQISLVSERAGRNVILAVNEFTLAKRPSSPAWPTCTVSWQVPLSEAKRAEV